MSDLTNTWHEDIEEQLQYEARQANSYGNALVDNLIYTNHALREFTQSDLHALIAAVADQAGASVETQEAIKKLLAKESR